MKIKLATLIFVAVIGLVLAACGSGSEDVPSLRDIESTQSVESTTEAADSVHDTEAAMMAFTECLRDQGIEVYDPVVDAEGNVEKPEFVEGVDPKGKDMGAAWETCAEHLERVTFAKERVDMSDYLDQALATTTCLRDKGYDLDDPKAETLGQWKGSFKDVINWDDPEEVADYEECAGDAGMGEGKK